MEATSEHEGEGVREGCQQVVDVVGMVDQCGAVLRVVEAAAG
ncbi:hypothetical protein ACIBO6_06830 [Streptomyces luteogriseus]